MKWRGDLHELAFNEDGTVNYKMYAEGDFLQLSVDEKVWMSQNIEKQGVKGWEFNDKNGVGMWIRMWGFAMKEETKQPIDPPIKPIDPPIDPPVECVDLANHGLARPHIFYDSWDGKIKGMVVSPSTFEFSSQSGGWKKATRLGKIMSDPKNRSAYLIEEGHLGNPYCVVLRSKEGCPEYYDGGNQSHRDTHKDDWALTTNYKQDLSHYPRIYGQDLGFVFSFGGGNMPSTFDKYPVYSLKIAGSHHNLRVKVDGELLATEIRQTDSNGIPLVHTAVLGKNDGMFFRNKDFCLDVLVGDMVDRYYVRAVSVGGHFSVINSIINLNSKRLQVCCNGMADYLLPCTFEFDGKTYDNSYFGSTFNNLPNKDGKGILRAKETGVLIGEANVLSE